MAPLTAFTGHGLLSLPQEPPAFSFSGTGRIYFLCHFGGCLPCQRLFCRVQTDKKVVSRLFGGGREDCLVRERRPLCSQQPHAALPLRPPLQGTRQGHPHTSPPRVFFGYICSWGHTGDQRLCSCARTGICLSWNLGNASDECSIQHLDCKSQGALATARALSAGDVENKKKGRSPVQAAHAVGTVLWLSGTLPVPACASGAVAGGSWPCWGAHKEETLKIHQQQTLSQGLPHRDKGKLPHDLTHGVTQ